MSEENSDSNIPTPANLYLGLDLSTQQLKAILLSEDGLQVHHSAVHFDKDLPAYGTVNGTIQGNVAGEVFSPVYMWLEAIDILMYKMKKAGVNFSSIVAVGGAAQQHGSVYWSRGADGALSSLDAGQSLQIQLCPRAFSSPNAPIWQDSSTTQECRALEISVGGSQELADITGSRAYERFTGPQIAKFRRTDPDAYESTSRISLISSFLPTLFLGRIAPIEASDASGMNLMNVLTSKWDDRLLEACGGRELRTKLGPEPVPGGAVLGTVSDWWVRRWGFKSDCIVSSFTGDNPATVISLSTPGDAILSLGTSSTLLLSIPPSQSPPKRVTTSHLLVHPTTIGAHISMLCFKNGSLAREAIRDRYAGGDWNRFNQLVEESPPGNNGYMGLYFPLPEIIPPNVHGEFLFSFGDAYMPKVTRVDSIPPTAHPRAVVESQFLSIRSRIASILPADAQPLGRLVVTGGSSMNQTILQVAADVFGMPVYICTGVGSHEAACMGGAILAKLAWLKHSNSGRCSPEDTNLGAMKGMACVAEPRGGSRQVYGKLLGIYRTCEDEVIRMRDQNIHGGIPSTLSVRP